MGCSRALGIAGLSDGRDRNECPLWKGVAHVSFQVKWKDSAVVEPGVEWQGLVKASMSTSLSSKTALFLDPIGHQRMLLDTLHFP
jgi:hypothetical protein